ncbi:MAG: PAC2 family protein [Bifidobacteriaceae bacterium]|jgi:predicted ATP-grasp superfamily ATP-dependent carboligase|nr:PAC2 family protein [Bifidobacteriaceae bacterium]
MESEANRPAGAGRYDRLYRTDPSVAAEVRAQMGADGPGPSLLYAFHGFLDAGMIAGLAIHDLKSNGDPKRLATFDVDQLIDYRDRRPPMVLGEEGWDSVRSPDLGIDLVHDADGRPLLLMSGPEPDFKWEEFIGAVREVAEDFRVEHAVSMFGVPVPVPHTRPLTCAMPTSRIAAAAGAKVPAHTRFQVPGSAQALLQLRLQEAGLDSVALTVHVPHYLAGVAFPAGTVELLRGVGELTGLNFDTSRLEKAARVANASIDSQVNGSEELTALVHRLEHHYDRRHPRQLPARPMRIPEDLPDGDEIAREIEAYLDQQAKSGWKKSGGGVTPLEPDADTDDAGLPTDGEAPDGGPSAGGEAPDGGGPGPAGPRPSGGTPGDAPAA